jgi:hypothetical protein
MCSDIKSYLKFIYGFDVHHDSVFIELKQFENQSHPDLKDFLLKTQNLFKDSFLSFPLAIGIDRYLQGMKNFHKIMEAFLKQKEESLAYAEALFLILEFMNEMLYDEYRHLQNVLEEILTVLTKQGLNKGLGILIAASLEREYLNPQALHLIENFENKCKLYQHILRKVKDNIVIC